MDVLYRNFHPGLAWGVEGGQREQHRYGKIIT